MAVAKIKEAEEVAPAAAPALPTELGKGVKVSFKNRVGVIIKGVVKRLSQDGNVVINGEDASRYVRETDEVIIIGGANEDLANVKASDNFKGKRRGAAVMPPNEKIKDVDVNTRFQYLGQLTRMVLTGTAVSLIITGEGGLGKTYTVKKEALRKKMTLNEDWLHIKGFSTAKGLYKTLYENNGKVLVFDDCDDVLENPIAVGLLKGALDSYDERIIHWVTAGSFGGDDLPSSFEFTGRIIFISNFNKEDIEQSILSRAMNIDIAMTRAEKVGRMDWIIHNSKDYMPSYPLALKEECLEVIKDYMEEVRELSLRTLEKVIKLKAGEKDMLDTTDEDYQKMDWKELAKFMLLS